MVKVKFEDVDIKNNYIIFEKTDEGRMTKSGIITDRREVTPIIHGIVKKADSEIIKEGDKIVVQLDKTQYITVEGEKYLLTLEKFVLGKRS